MSAVDGTGTTIGSGPTGTLLDFSLSDPDFLQQLEVKVQQLYGARSEEERRAAQAELTTLQTHPQAWTRVDKILDASSSSEPSKFFALQILESLIKYRWKTLPLETRESIKLYVQNKAIILSSTAESLVRERTFLSKLNLILVRIVAQEWPSRWRTLITDIVNASKTSSTLCENNLNILRLLSEEVFDFSADQMTQEKIDELKTIFQQDFREIYELCEYVLCQRAFLQQMQPSLLVTTVQTLEKFLSRIEPKYVFETDLLESLLELFDYSPELRNSVMRCLVEISSLSVSAEYDQRFVSLYMNFISKLAVTLPLEVDIAAQYDQASEATQNFIMDLALFFGGFFGAHASLLERSLDPAQRQALVTGNMYLVRIARVNDIEILKVCLEWWHTLTESLYQSLFTIMDYAVGERVPLLPDVDRPALERLEDQHARRQLYASVLYQIALVMIQRMAKPEEVLIVEDENGEIVRETTKDTDMLALYKTMRETCLYLTHIDPLDIETIMIEKLDRQLDGSEWSWQNLNTLCWAIGSISGAMNEESEKRFLIHVIKDLLRLCEEKRGKDNKAVVAANIMYVVGQYPRFLRAHWRFLKTVVNKLFEFMHESHPGVKDMACDTFLKIVQTCRRQFVVVHSGEHQSFVSEMLEKLETTIDDLEPHQVHSFYESAATMISAETIVSIREAYISRLYETPNQRWRTLLEEAILDENLLFERDRMKELVHILRLNVRGAQALGPFFYPQLVHLYMDMLALYQRFSQMVSNAVASSGVIATRHADVRNMRAVKKEVLRLIETFFELVDRDPEVLRAAAEELVEPLTEPVLGDYARSVPDARDAEVLTLYAVIVEHIRTYPNTLTLLVPIIFRSCFNATLEMITTNFEDFPDHRIGLFQLLRSMNGSCFAALFSLDPDPTIAEQSFQLVINAIVWAFKHTERNVAETGLQTLLELLRNLETSGHAEYFYERYYFFILNDILAVLTDTLHKPGFSLQAQVLMHLFQAARRGQVRLAQPLTNDGQATAPVSSEDAIRIHLQRLLESAFPNMGPVAVRQAVDGMFLFLGDERLFKQNLRDFLVRTKEFLGGDNTDLYEDDRRSREIQMQRALAAVPGMQNATRNADSDDDDNDNE
jgi:exportin-1